MLKVFAVRDVKADAFGNPICVQTKGLAVRAFSDACADPRSPMAQYPEDYMLYEIGKYDPATGLLSGISVPELVATASEIIASRKPVASVEVPS